MTDARDIEAQLRCYSDDGTHRTRLIIEAADTIASLRKQLEDAREVITEANNSLYGSQCYFLSLDGGPPNKYHLAEGIERLKSNAKALRSLPTDDGVTDEMVERAAQAWLEKASDYELLEVSIRAALEAALDRTKSELANIGKQ